MSDEIYFYASRDPYLELSNFYERPIEIDGKEWMTIEHYFQASKFENCNYQEIIRSVLSPMEARELGQSREYKIRSDWNRVKEDVMIVGLRAKFKTPTLKVLLLETGSRMLIEKSPHDNYWGSGKSGNGRNRLGYLLMQVRSEMTSDLLDNANLTKR